MFEAARAAVAAAERTRRAECGDGDPKKRGLKCEAREKDEATARTAAAKRSAGCCLWPSAATAATFQQGLVSAIAELLIAAALALPERMHRKPRREALRQERLRLDQAPPKLR